MVSSYTAAFLNMPKRSCSVVIENHMYKYNLLYSYLFFLMEPLFKQVSVTK